MVLRLLSDREVEAGPEGQSSSLQCVGTAGIVDVEESIGVEQAEGYLHLVGQSDSNSAAPGESGIVVFRLQLQAELPLTRVWMLVAEESSE